MTDAENHALTTDKLDRLIAATNRQTESNEDLAVATVEYQERARLARRRFRLTISAILGVTLIMMIVLVAVLSKMNDDLTSAARSRAQLADCIRPTGHCYKDGQKRTVAVIGSVQKIIVLAASCAPTYVGLPISQRTLAIERCIERGLK